MSEAHAARVAFFNKKRQKRTINFVIPGMEEWTGKLAVMSLSARDMRIANKYATDKDGRIDPLISQGAAICRGLIINETAERVFTDNDLDFIVGNDKPDGGVGGDAPMDGLDVFDLKSIGDLIADLSGMNFNAVEIWKKNSLATQQNDSSSSSTES